MFTKDQNFGTVAIPQDIEILGWCQAGPVLPHGVTLIVSVTIKTPYGVDVLHQPASPFFSYRVG